MTAMKFRLACLAFAIAAALMAVIWWNPAIVRTDAGNPAASPSLGSPFADWHPAAIRKLPLRFPVRSDLQSLVSDRELRMVLETAVPRWDPPTVPIMLHALRLWGTKARFPMPDKSPEYIGDCGAFRRILLHDAECVRIVGKFDEFLIDTRYGVRVLTSGDPIKASTNSEGHCDQVLKVLGECGIPASEAITTAAHRRGMVADLLGDSMARFSLLQELEFSACAFARWLPPTRSWENRFGERFTFDDLVRALVEQPLGRGSCQGCHVPYALTSILLASQGYPDLISAASRSTLEGRLREMSQCLEANELPGGGWDKRWTGQYVDNPENIFFEFKPHFDRISATAHHLEWIALVPPKQRPERTIVERAVRALVVEITSLSNEDLDKPKGYLPLTHAARALCLTRGHDCAFPLWQQLQGKSE
jgi:hypothetical protein